MKTAVVYYSLTGNTEYAAQWIAGRIGGETVRLEPEKKYPDKGFRKFFWGGKSAVMQEEPPLEPYDFEADRFHQVVLCTPLWAGNIAPPLRTFLKQQGQKILDKRVAVVMCCGGGSEAKAMEKLQALLGRPFHARLVLVDPKDRPAAGQEEKMAQFCQALAE